MKTMTKLFRRTLLATAIAGLFSMSAGAATIDVNTTSDVIDPNDDACSLRVAVIAANTNTASGGTANECAAGEDVGTAVDVINIPAGTYTLTIAPVGNTLGVGGAPATYTYGEYTLDWNAGQSTFDPTVTPNADNGDLDITESVNLVGADMATTIIDAGWIPNPANAANDVDVDPDTGAVANGISDRVFHVAVDAIVDVAVQMSDLTIMGGRTPEVIGLVNPSAVEYYLRLNGGGLAVGTAAGTYNPNATNDYGAPEIVSGVPGPSYSIDLQNVTITQNYSGDGGGFYNGGTATANLVNINENRGYANGGGMYNDGVLTLTNSTINANGAEGGGGIFDTGNGERSIKASTLSNNGAVGGGAYNGRSGVHMDMTNSTISGNTARDMGAGALTNGILHLVHVTLSTNTTYTDAFNAGSGVMTFPSGSLEIGMQDVVLNKNLKGIAAFGSADCGAAGGAAGIVVNSLGHNMSQDTSCNLSDTTDTEATNAMLLPLTDNGGPTLTHALPYNSPAVNTGGVLGSTTVDQRGVARDGTPDIGAYEYVSPPASSKGGSDSKNIFGCSLGNPQGFDPTLLFVVLASLLYLGRRKLREVKLQDE